MISSTFDKNKVFTVMWSELENNLCSKFYVYIPTQLSDWVRLKSIANIDPLRQLNYTKDYINYVGLAETNDHKINNVLARPYNEVKGRKLIKNGDVLFARIEPSIFNKKYIYVNGLTDVTLSSTEFNVIEAKDPNDAKFILYMLISNPVYQQFTGKLTGSTGRRRLDKGVLKNIWIPYPSKEKRRNIVSIMDEAFLNKNAKLSQAEELLKSIDTYLLSELNLQLPELKNDLADRKYIVKSKEIIGNRFDGFYNRPEFIDFLNKVLLLSNNTTLCDVIYGESGVVYKTEDERNSGIGILRANNIDLQSNELDLSDIKYINDELVLPKRQKLLANDILMCSASGSKSHAGKVAFIENDLPYYFGGFMMVLRAKSEVNMRYVFEYMCSSIYRTLLFRSLGGTNINNVNFELIKNIPIILPDNQTEIINKIKHIRECAKTLKIEAQQCIDSARVQIEQIILGD